jgi:hypothetical protein
MRLNWIYIILFEMCYIYIILSKMCYIHHIIPCPHCHHQFVLLDREDEGYVNRERDCGNRSLVLGIGMRAIEGAICLG